MLLLAANRDRFILPEQHDINIFTNVFDDAVKWFDDIDDNLIMKKLKNKKEMKIKKSIEN